MSGSIIVKTPRAKGPVSPALVLPAMLLALALPPWASAQGGQAAGATPVPVPAPGRGEAVAPAPTAAAVERTTAQFGDWSLNCAGPAGQGRRCEAAQLLRGQNGQVAAALAVGRPDQAGPMKLVLQVPVNLQVAQPARLSLEGEATVELPFRSCNALGCFAEVELGNDTVLGRLRDQPAEQPVRLEWRDAAGGALALPVSLRGFVAASDALKRDAG
jgi:invasion protein IalB